MVGLSEIRTEIAAIISGVTGVGHVHEYDRWANNWETFLSFFKDSTGKINGCTITRKEAPEARSSLRLGDRSHKFVIRFIFGLQDASQSEIAFQDLLEAVQTALNQPGIETLNGKAINSGPAGIDLAENRMFGSVLCHYAEISFPAIERVRY